MSHTEMVNLIADQEIELCGVKVNIHDIVSVEVDNTGKITDAFIDTPTHYGWISDIAFSPLA